MSPTTTAPPEVYLDHAATTPVLAAAADAMLAQLRRTGNPGSLHGAGRAARRVVEESRERIAQAVDARPAEVVLTSGGTEADNLAVKGTYWIRRQQDPRRVRILTTGIEHHAVLDSAEWLATHEGAVVEHVRVAADGRLDVAALAESIQHDPTSVALVSVMWANNEVGVVQPVEQVATLAAAYGIPVHTDAVQSVGAVPLSFATSGVGALSLTGHKLGGPVGAGALVVRRELTPVPLLHGGGQEHGLRSGTVPVPAVAALAAAVEHAVKHQAETAERLSALRDRLVAGVRSAVPDARVNGDPVRRLPGNAHLSFPGCEGDALLMLLDARGIRCSTGSACSAGVPRPSHVLLAMGLSAQEARGSLRLSLGHTSTAADVDALVAAIGPVVEQARAAGR